MTIGFYYLAVLLSFAVTFPLRAHAGISMVPADLVAFPAGVCLLVEVLRDKHTRRLAARTYRRNRAVCWYIGWILVSAVAQLWTSTSSAQIAKELLPSFILYFLICMSVDRPGRVGPIVVAYFAGVLLNSSLAVSQATAGGPYINALSTGVDLKLDFAGETVSNAIVGLFSHPNALAMFLLAPVVVLFAFIRQRGFRWRPHALAAFALVGFTLYATQVKGVFAFAGLAIVLVLVSRLPPAWWRALLVAAPIAAIATLTLYSLQQVAEGEQAYATMITRVGLWSHALDILTESYSIQALGGGYEAFGLASVGSFEYPNAHNAWLNHGLSFGLPGLLLYLGLFYSGIKLATEALVRTVEPAARTMLIGIAASLSALGGEYFFEPSDRGEVFSSQLMWLLAVAVVVSHRRRGTDE